MIQITFKIEYNKLSRNSREGHALGQPQRVQIKRTIKAKETTTLIIL